MHTASQISGLTSANIAFNSLNKVNYNPQTITTTSSFTPEFAILFCVTNNSSYTSTIHFAHKDSTTDVYGLKISYTEISTATYMPFSFNTNSVSCTRLESYGTYTLITLG